MDTCSDIRAKLAQEFKQHRDAFVALGDENRQGIFLALLEGPTEGMRVTELTEQSSLSRPAVSHHLKVLRDARLINMRSEGTRNFYYVDPKNTAWLDIAKLFEHISKAIENCSFAENDEKGRA